MATEAKLHANRRNARRSTGPRTPAGKSRSSRNATRHGLLSRETLLATEDGEALDTLRAELVAVLAPVGALEELLVDRVVSAAWRLRRAAAVERGLFERNLENNAAGLAAELGMKVRAPDVGLAFVRDGNGNDAFSRLVRYETALERGLLKALHELQRVQAARNGGDVEPPGALDLTLAGGFVSQNADNGHNGNVEEG